MTGMKIDKMRLSGNGKNLPIDRKSVIITILAVIIAIGIGWYSSFVFKEFIETEDYRIRMIELSGTITHLDEVLTMSANMAAATGNPAWEYRYRAFEPMLRDAINEVMDLAATEEMRIDISRTDEANQILVAMELNVFDLVREGNLEEAMSIMQSSEYATQKEIYSDGMSDFIVLLEDHFEQQHGFINGLILISLVVLVIFGALAVFWWVGSRNMSKELGRRTALENSLEENLHNIGERVKELNCLYGISDLASKPNTTLAEMIQGTVDLIPPSWQYPEITCARIVINDETFKSENFKETEWRQSVDLIIDLNSAGVIEVYYLEEKPEADEGPFMKEERNLINAISIQISEFVKRIRTDEEILSQKEIAETESQKLRSMIEGMDDGIVVADADDRIIEINSWLLNFAGVKREEIIGRKIWDFHSGEANERIKGLLDHYHSNEHTDVVAFEKELDGTFINLRIQPMFRDNEYSGVILNVIDITDQKLSEGKLRSLAMIAEQATEGIAVSDFDGTIQFVNPAWVEMHGYDRTFDLIGQNLSVLHTDEQMKTEVIPFNKAVKQNGQNTGEVGHIRKDGSTFPSEMRVSLFRDIEGEPIGFISLMTDITERKQDEKKLTKLNRILAETTMDLKDRSTELETIIQASPMGIFLIDAETRKIVRASSAAIRMLGKSEDQIIGEGCHLCIFRSECNNCPIMDLGQEHGVVENSFIRPDGKIVQVIENSVSVTIGGRPHVLDFFTDITERKEAEQERAQLATIIEQANEIIMVSDLESNIEYVNPAFSEATGYTSEEIIGQNARILLGITKNQALGEEIEERLIRGESWSGRIMTKKKDGSDFNQELTICPIRDSDGKIINSVTIGRDVTEQIAMELQLLQAQKLESIGQLAAGIAHEINTPMQYIGDNTEFVQFSIGKLFDLARKQSEMCTAIEDDRVNSLLLAEVREVQEKTDIEKISTMVEEAIEESIGGIKHVTEIVLAMKEFSHMGSKEKTTIDINKAIQSTKTIARNEWKYVSDLETDFDKSIPPVNCYAGEINQVILNLITNAAHAIGEKLGKNPGEKGKITIRTRMDGDQVEIRISDTGTGIPEEIRDKIFDPFFTTKKVGKGTGQGLAITRNVIVDKHSGSIDLESEMGKGSTFIIRLPVDSGREGEAA